MQSFNLKDIDEKKKFGGGSFEQYSIKEKPTFPDVVPKLKIRYEQKLD